MKLSFLFDLFKTFFSVLFSTVSYIWSIALLLILISSPESSLWAAENNQEAIDRALKPHLPSGMSMPSNLHRENKPKDIKIESNAFTKSFLKFFHVEIKTAPSLANGERKILDITQSYFGLTIGDKVDEVIKNPSIYDSERRFFVGLNIKTSVAPPILKGTVKQEVRKEILDKVRAGAMSAAAIKVVQAFEAQVKPGIQAGKITAAEYQAILYKNIEQTQSAVAKNEALIQSLAQHHIDEANKRIDTVATETILQQLSVKFAWLPSKNHNVIIFGTVGKDQVNGNLDEGLRNLTAFGGWANIANSTQGTGMAHLGVTTAINDKVKVSLESWVFHDRAPLRGAQSLVYNVTTMNDIDYRRQKEITDLDSNMQKLTIQFPSPTAESESNTVYLNTGSYNSERTFGGGAIFKITPQISFQIEGNMGRKDLADYTLMEAILFKTTERLTLYVANENVKNLRSPYYQEAALKPAQLGKVSFGANYTLAAGKFMRGLLHYSLNVTAGVGYYYKADGLYRDGDMEYFGGVKGLIRFN